MMMRFKKSSKWIIVFIVYTILIFAALLITRFILGKDSPGKSILGLIVLSLSSAFIASIGGYLGRRLFFWIYSASVLLGLFYTFYVVLGDIAPGWGDLTSMIGYLFIVLGGIVIACIVEIISFIIKKSKQ